MKVIRYSSEMKKEWDDFVENAKNSLFMFKRDYMEYHKYRFIDHSLMFYGDKGLISVIPLSIDEGTISSHGGLTFGGFITDSSMKQGHMNDLTDSLISYMKDNGLGTLRYKQVPHIYHDIPAEEDEYSLFWKGATLEKMECATVIDLKNRINLPKGRKAQISRAKREGVEVVTSTDYERFIALENDVLEEYHQSHAVHTGKELQLLHDRFPDNIRLMAGMYKGEMIAGAVLYIYKNVVKTQYLASDDTSRKIGGLDLVLSEALDYYTDKKKWFDFGKSTEDDGHILNNGLIAQKESFGGRTVMYKTWKVQI